ncbi:Glycosyl hydrolase family protein [Hibiscus syriacus]|uniref:Glycosyl hydrolase family protein n=1 Tax=Hibiscus syriacus TaxID=106335 RepID=A0A6A3AG62_HIBSY|nr:Glycosyl hydrolase family protein [Hibiscus syriacus]
MLVNSQNQLKVQAKVGTLQPLEEQLKSLGLKQGKEIHPTAKYAKKELLRQRDVTLLAVVEALQEAAGTEKLLKCLSKFSKLQLAKEDQQPSINKFFKLQDFMAQWRTIVQSLTNISPQRMADCDLINPGSAREALKLAVGRSRNATTRVKAAVASDLVPLSTSGTKEGKNQAKNMKQSSQITLPKGGYMITKQRSNGEFHSDLAAEKENIPNWVKGISIMNAFQRYLIAESMCQIKRLNDWLDTMESDGKSTSRGPEFEAYGRVRNKIYEVLLKHVERTAVVLENMNAIC